MSSIFKQKPKVSYPKVGRFRVRIESYPDDSLTRSIAARFAASAREHWSTALVVMAVLGISAAIYSFTGSLR